MKRDITLGQHGFFVEECAASEGWVAECYRATHYATGCVRYGDTEQEAVDNLREHLSKECERLVDGGAKEWFTADDKKRRRQLCRLLDDGHLGAEWAYEPVFAPCPRCGEPTEVGGKWDDVMYGQGWWMACCHRSGCGCFWLQMPDGSVEDVEHFDADADRVKLERLRVMMEEVFG